MAPFITFLSDYGRTDDFVGVCHAVMARLAPDARVVDITHGIDRHDIRTGAMVLRNTLPYAPAPLAPSGARSASTSGRAPPD